MPVCVITGTLRDIQGQILPNTQVVFQRRGVYGQDGSVIIPRNVTVTSNSNGLLTVSLYPGVYDGVTQGGTGSARFSVGVPDEATARFSDIIDQLPAITPSLVAEVLAARDQIVAAVGAPSWQDLEGGTSDYTELTNVPTAFPPEAHTHPLSEITGVGTAAAQNVTAFATAAQGVLAGTATQPGDLATVATSGAYVDLTGRPTLGTAAAQNVTAFATAAQGVLASTAIQPEYLTGALRTLYVDPAGNDANEGSLASRPLKTITAALAKALSGTAILVQSGHYVEPYPLIVPRDVSALGTSLRNVIVRPTDATKYNHAWLVDSGAYLYGMTFAGHQQGSFAVAFNADANNTAIGATGLGAFIFKSPYIQNCTSYTAQDDAGVAGSTSTGTTGGGMEVDGAKCAPNSPIRSMVVDSYTQVNLDGPGCVVKNDAYAQLVSFFGTFCSYHVKAESGGQVNLSNSTTNFGTFGLVADGRSATPIFSGTAAAAADQAQSITVGSMTASRIGPSSRPAAGMVFDAAGQTYTITGAIPNGSGWTVNFFPRLSGALAGGETVTFFNRSQISTGGHVMEFVGSGTNYNALPWFGGVPVPANEIVETGSGRVFFSSTDQLGNFRVGKQFDVNGTTGSVTINTDQFNLSGLNAIGPFSRNGVEAAGVQLQEISNNVDLLASTGVADGNTVPTQFAVQAYLEARYTLTAALGAVALSNAYADLTGLPSLGTAAAQNVGAFATAGQGSLADSAIQPGDLAAVAISGSYGDLDGLPTLGTASALNVGVLANQIVQLDPSGKLPALDASQLTNIGAATGVGDVAGPSVSVNGHVALFDGTSGKMVKSSGTALGTAAAQDVGAFATAAQGALADSAVQPGDVGTLAAQNANAVTFTGSIQEGVFAITGTAPALDPANGTIQTHALTGATVYADALSSGEAITLMIDDGAGFAITWPTMTWTNNKGEVPTLATTGYTTVQLWKVGTTLYGALVGSGA